jgi:enoyl-CoA hydratase/3-hydroxyacyl-CoA dehydrogenase
MDYRAKLYPSAFNPLLIKPHRPLPKEVAVIGTGTIGPDIGYYLKNSLPGIKLILVDIAEEPLKSAEKRFAGYVQKSLDRGRMKEEQAKAVLGNIVYTTDYAQVKNCDLIIEAATENTAVKQRIFAQIEDIVDKDTIITSNTGSIPASRLFSEMKKPQRATVTHFFAPAWQSLPVEVVAWEKASQEIVDYLFWIFAVTGKAPIITNDALCFALNRIWNNWCNEAAYLLDVASASQIDHVAEEFVPAGPFYVLSTTKGNPIVFEANTLQMEEGSHYRPAPVLRSTAEWPTLRPGTPVEVPEKIKNIVRDRLLGILFSQSFDIINREIGTPEDLNFGCRVALSFRNGPFDIMKELGETEVNRIMSKFQAERPGFPTAQKSFSEYQDFRHFILVDEMDGVKIITIRRPEVMNAINDEVNDEILGVFQENINNPSVKGFVITAYGQAAFSSGAEIGKFLEVLGNKEASVQYSRDCAKVQLFMDKMVKPVVAAVDGLAWGGGLEIAIRCHSIIATRKSTFRFAEITLGILPGIGGCIVPYRRWPQGAKVFHEMICSAKPIGAEQAADIRMVSKLVDNYYDMIQEAVKEVGNLQGKVKPIPDGKVDIPEVEVPEQPMAGKLPLSKEAVAIAARTIRDGAAAETFAQALEIGYEGFGEIACTEAAKEGISAFLEKRQAEFRK